MNYTSIKDLHEALLNKEHTLVEYIEHQLKKIEEKRGLNVFIEVYDDVLDQAEEVQNEMDKGNFKRLSGVPIAVKDNIVVKNKTATAGSAALKDFVSTYDADVIQALKAEGAILIGRTNMDEFGVGSSTINEVYGTTKNPHNENLVCGGSSGGSACAVASGLTLLALGSDTGGSVRQPASYCGIVGLKPTYGAISRYGLIALASSLDVVGIFGNNIEDTEICFDILEGYKSDKDSTYKLWKSIDREKGKKTIGVPKQLSSQTRELINPLLKEFEQDDYKILDVDIPLFDKAFYTYYIIQPAETASNLARYDGVRYGNSLKGENLFGDYIKTRSNSFGKGLVRRIIMGTYFLSEGYADEYYRKAVRVRDELTREFISTLKEVDVLIYPTVEKPAFGIDLDKPPMDIFKTDILAVQASLIRMPAVSVPIKAEGLPMGVQIISGFNDEDVVFEYAKKIESYNK